MENTCAPAPINKKEYITAIGKILVKEHGKKKFYKPKEIKKAHQNSNWVDVLDFSCWGMVMFSSHSDFDEYHKKIGEVCDYVAMKTEMLNGLSISLTTDWFEIPNLDLDASWLDLGDVFDGILEGIGEIISGIFDGL